MTTTVKKATKTMQLGDLELDLKLGGREVFKIERQLGKSMLSLFMDSQGGNKLPPVNEILIVLQGANQNHGVTDKRVLNAFEKYLDDGNTTMDLFNALMELFEASGFFGKKKKSSKTNSESDEVTLDPVEAGQDQLLQTKRITIQYQIYSKIFTQSLLNQEQTLIISGIQTLRKS